jgi:cytochrome P450
VIPHYDADLFTDDALDDPYPHLRALRDAGPIVWLEAHDMFAVTRYADERDILADAATFISGEGVGLNDVVNTVGRGTTLISDSDEHRRQREIIGRPLTPRALADLRADAPARLRNLLEEAAPLFLDILFCGSSRVQCVLAPVVAVALAGRWMATDTRGRGARCRRHCPPHVAYS